VLAKLPKKTRWTIRKGLKELQALGTLEYDHVTKRDGVNRLMQNIYEVESCSWKDEIGTSITAQTEQRRFYEALVEVASDSGLLSAHVLRLNDKPVAYILGLTSADGTFLDLKESFARPYADYSPGHVLKRFAIATLIASGTRIYDFMGACEPYKMRWTDKTYRRVTLSIYNQGLRGRFWYWRSRLGRALVPRREQTDIAIRGDSA
jgi:CelD/BcsL family acetyltransferase involved in cellulose biosynthesis